MLSRRCTQMDADQGRVKMALTFTSIHSRSKTSAPARRLRAGLVALPVVVLPIARLSCGLQNFMSCCDDGFRYRSYRRISLSGFDLCGLLRRLSNNSLGWTFPRNAIYGSLFKYQHPTNVGCSSHNHRRVVFWGWGWRCGSVFGRSLSICKI